MPIYTPSGLKIRFTPTYAITLMARLWPMVHPVRFLRTVEAIDTSPSAYAFAAATVSVSLRSESWVTGVVTFVAYLIGLFAVALGIPGATWIGRAYSSGLHLLFQIAFVVGILYFAGWKSLLAYAVGRIAAAIVRFPIEFSMSGRMASATGQRLTASERNFLRAYFMYANRYRRSLDVSIDAVDVDPEACERIADRLASEMPDQFRRFSEA